MTSSLVRATDIAKLAGVSRAAITQWRKKFKTFPKQVEGADSPSPLFDLAQVEQWLIENGRMPEPSTEAGESAPTAGEVAARSRATGSDEVVIGAYLAAEHLARAAADGPVRTGIAAGLSVPLRRADGTVTAGFADVEPQRILGWVHEVIEVQPGLRGALGPLAEQSADRVGPLQRFIGTLDARFGSDWRTREPDSIFETFTAGKQSFAPPEYTTFLVDLAGLEHGVLLDPCTGWGEALIEAGRRCPDLQLVGVDADPACVAIAQQRAILHDLDLDLRVGDSISSDDPAAGVVADAVVSMPALGPLSDAQQADRHDPRWVFARPGRDAADRWLQQAVEHLSEEGRAFVVTGGVTADGRQAATLRHELLRRGVIEAVISIETPRQSVGFWVWVLARPGRTVDPDRVLMVDAPAARDQPDGSFFDDIVGIYRRWRTDGEHTPSEYVAAVPTRELLEPGTGLVPSMWIARASAPSPEALIEKVREAEQHRGALTDDTAPHSLAPLIPLATTARTEKLPSLSGVTILRGTVRPAPHGAVSSCAPVRVLSSRVLAELDQGAAVDDVAPLAIPFENPNPVRTRSGDIHVELLHYNPDPGAVTVLDVDDWAVGIHTYLIRVDDSLVDRWFLVACIRAAMRQPWNGRRSPTRSTLDRIDIPVLPLEEQQRIGQVVRELDREQAALARRMQATRQLRDAVEGAVATGAITVGPTPDPAARPVVKPRTAALRQKQAASARKKRTQRPGHDATE
ncbi:MAG: N-6 DNA methylase [Rhodococcus sp. (in: high G+C Gram-positive bacteria)]|uniref:N-6 DNA methylase n=1 Tax=Rhodococcus sp. TaxID=1831 RepID=UPI003BB5BE00